MIKVPSVWNKNIENNDLKSGYGIGTYHLKINGLHELPGIMSLKIDSIYSAYTVWINGENVYSSGSVDLDNNTSHGVYKKDLLIFENSEETIDLLIQVSNFEFDNGGIWKPIFFGSIKEIQKYREIGIIYASLLLGAFIFIGIYHVYLSYYLDNSRVVLSYGLFCLILGIRLLIMGESMIFNLANNISYNIQQKIEFITFYLGTATMFTYVYSRFSSYIKKWIYKSVIYICIAFTLFTAIVNLPLFIQTLKAFQIITLIICVLILYIFIKATINKEVGASATLLGMKLIYYLMIYLL